MKIRLFFYVCLILLSWSLSAQENDHNPFYLYENIPSSPEVSGLGTYGNTGVNSYNGKVSLAVPIHTINFEGMSIPINLSYDSGGVKVAQDASWVGLNWNLSSTFTISRSVFGIDDFRDEINGQTDDLQPIGWIHNNFEVYLPEGAPAPVMDYQNAIVPIHQSFSMDNGNPDYYDTQPDIFDANFLGKSYKFRLQKKTSSNTLQTYVYNDNNVKIIYDLPAKKFTITDDQGFIYEFGTYEINTSFSSIPDRSLPDGSPGTELPALQNIVADENRIDESLITTWHLDQITAPSGEQLHFQYKRALHFTFPHYSAQFKSAHDIWTNAETAADEYVTEIMYGEQYNATTTVIEQALLETISGDFGSVAFQSSPRLDLLKRDGLNTLTDGFLGSHPLITERTYINVGYGNNPTDEIPLKLDAIQVKDYLGNTIVNAGFNFDYFRADKLNASDKERYLRLKLDGVTINEKTYSFEYLGDFNGNLNGLPAKDSKAVDFWGFYNGINNTRRIPNIGRFVNGYFNNTSSTIGHTYVDFKNGANRKARFDYGKRGNLSKITYPTGGYTTLEYEGHSAVLDVAQPYIVTEYYNNGNRIYKTNTEDESVYNFTYQYLKRAKTPSYNYYENRYDNTTTQQQQVQIGEVFTVPFSTAISGLADVTCQYNCQYIPQWSNFGILVAENVNNPSIKRTIYRAGQGPAGDVPGTNYNVPTTKIIPAGNYILKRKFISGQEAYDMGLDATTVTTSNEDLSVIVQTTGTEENPDLPQYVEQFEIGGMRIKSITHHNNDGGFVSKKQYDYTLEEHPANANSSGILMNDLLFFSKVYGVKSYSPRGWAGSGLKVVSDNVLKTPMSAQGSHIGYSFVKEINLDKDDVILGWTARDYNNTKNANFTEDISLPFYHIYDGCSEGSGVYANASNLVILGLDPQYSFAYENGNVIKEEHFNCNGVLVSQTLNEYQLLIGAPLDDYYTKFIPIFSGLASQMFNPCDEVPFALDQSTHYPYRPPTYYSYKSVMTRSETKQYLENDILTQAQEYSYDFDTHHLLQTKQIVEEDTQEYTATRYYPYSTEISTDPGMWTLRNENRLGTVVLSESHKNNQTLGKQKFNYSGFHGNTLVSSAWTAKANDPLERRVAYENFDTEGRLLQTRAENGVPTSYIWGYNNQYIIAKIENATYSQVSNLAVGLKSLADADNDSCGATGNCQEQNLRNALNALQDEPSLANTLISTYTYDPLIGVTSMTDPSGITVYYEYDNFNRLTAIRDLNHDLLTTYSYTITDELINSLGEDAVGLTSCTTIYEAQATQDDGQGDNEQIDIFDPDDDIIIVDEDNNEDPDPDPDPDSGNGDGDPPPIEEEDPFNTDQQRSADQRLASSSDFPERKLLANNKIQFNNQVYKRLNAAITLDAVTNGTANYTAHPYGGTGNFQYRWKLKQNGQSFTTFSNTKTWSLGLDCTTQGLDVEIICEVKDLTDGLIYRTRIIHPTFCTN